MEPVLVTGGTIGRHVQGGLPQRDAGQVLERDLEHALYLGRVVGIFDGQVQRLVDQRLDLLVTVVGGVEEMPVLVGPEEVVAGVVQPATEAFQMQRQSLLDQ